MSPIWKKLNLKDQAEIVVVAAPASFEADLTALEDVKVVRSLAKAKSIAFALVFATQQSQVDTAAKKVAEKTAGDAVVWFAYPKGTSKNFACDFNRDTGWKSLGEAGFEPVRQIAIDDDWSALRFRRVEHIAVLTRDPKMTLSAEGKRRAKASRRSP